MKNLMTAALLLLCNYVAFCKIYLIHNVDDYQKISARIMPGDVVNIANGTYAPWALTIDTHGTAAKYITIKAQTAGRVIFTGDVTQSIFKLTGSYTILSGITFTACNILRVDNHDGVLAELSESKYCRLTNCTFTKNEAKVQFKPIVLISGNGDHNEVDHCTFTSNLNNQEVQVRIVKESCPQHTLIDNNIFKDKEKVTWKVFNGGECVQVGQDPVLLGTIMSNTLVRDNHFIRCSGEAEVISNKSSNNAYIHNSFEDCDGELVMRGGHDCLIDSNIIKGGNSGIRVNGTGHRITNNQISNVKTAIRLMYGMAKSKNEIGFYIAASDCLIQNNQIENVTTGILIGDSKNADWTGKFDTKRYPSRVIQDVPPANITLGNNTFTKAGTNVAKVDE
jgi:poly(beta-D-mannuronate) lyase